MSERQVDQLDIPETQRQRFDRIKAECTDPYCPPPTDEQILKSLLDTWDAASDGFYSLETDTDRSGGEQA